jgi:ribonucleoside-diphosphate reductase alpha chain
VLYRDERSRARAQEKTAKAASAEPSLHVVEGGARKPLDLAALDRLLASACAGLEPAALPAAIRDSTLRDLYDGVPMDEVRKSSILAARALIEKDPAYSYATARLLLHTIRLEVLGEEVLQEQMAARYASSFPGGIRRGIAAELLDPRLGDFDLVRLGQALRADRDLQFGYLGLQTLYDRYFLHEQGQRIELPQAFFMRVAMGLALNEKNREARALLAKYAGGLGNDWTPVRALGSHIKGTNGKSQGVVPFLKVVNDTAVAVNQGGKRKGAVCSYLETWHLDIEEFLELRKNTGDDRRRTHDMNTANWIPDLFMKRVMENAEWTLFSPSDAPELHDTVGRKFEEAYRRYEDKVARGELKLFKKIPAVQLWRKMLSMLFETGHPWITFKDPCNLRSPQQHVGVVHSSNLCTEITLNTSEDEIAVCNLGSVNLVAHLITKGDGSTGLDFEKLTKTIRTAMRMLDNVIDINYYAVDKAKNSNLRHRPVGMGIMGFQDCLHKLRIAYASNEAVEFADRSMEMVSYCAYWASTELAEERGQYPTFRGSLWDRGILPQDTLDLLAAERGGYVELDRSSVLDWEPLRKRIRQHGMRNSNCVAIAPTATIANIIGVSASLEPTYQNLYVKSNLSGEFTVVNEYLVADLKRAGLWDEVMISDLKYFDGNLARIDRAPAELRHLYATAFEIEPKWLVEAGARRQKWIDQSQSLNIYMPGASGKKLDETYKLAWLRGLKTTYYLRAMGATHAEKSTSKAGALNAVPSDGGMAASGAASTTDGSTSSDAEPKFCAIDNPECEACQ